MESLTTSTTISSSSSVRRQTLTVRDGIPPGGKRLGVFDERINQERQKELSEHPDTQPLFGSGRDMIEIEQASTYLDASAVPAEAAVVLRIAR